MVALIARAYPGKHGSSRGYFRLKRAWSAFARIRGPFAELLQISGGIDCKCVAREHQSSGSGALDQKV